MCQSGETESPRAAAAPLRVVALVAGELEAPQLWALAVLAASPHSVSVVRVKAPAACRAGLPVGITGLIARHELDRQRKVLERVFDGSQLRAWLASAGMVVAEVPVLDRDAVRAAVGHLAPDIVVSLIGIEPMRDLAAVARRATLALALGGAAADAERTALLRAMVEGRAEQVGAGIYLLAAGGAAPVLLARARPQLVPGADGDATVFRACVEAVALLRETVDAYASGTAPATGQLDGGRELPQPGLWTWLHYLATRRGRTARATCERALRC